MKCDTCRWFNKNGFASGTGDCVLHRFVCGSGHEACEHYEEYEPRLHGTWLERYHKRFKYYCSNCGSGTDRKGKFCDCCGSDNRKMGDNDDQL